MIGNGGPSSDLRNATVGIADIAADRPHQPAEAFCSGSSHDRERGNCYRVKGFSGAAFMVKAARRNDSLCSCGLTLFWTYRYVALTREQIRGERAFELSGKPGPKRHVPR